MEDATEKPETLIQVQPTDSENTKNKRTNEDVDDLNEAPKVVKTEKPKTGIEFGRVKKIESIEDWKKYVDSKKENEKHMAAIMISKSWCGVCKTFLPTWIKMSKRMDMIGWDFVYVCLPDDEDEGQLHKTIPEITKFPTFIKKSGDKFAILETNQKETLSNLFITTIV
jgi:thiol-disulfide isomerase/thioredoxin